jgi:hypothetical protein
MFMKQKLFRIAVLFSAVSLLSACSDKGNTGSGGKPVETPDPNDPVNNTVTFGENSFLINSGEIGYYGNAFGDEVENIGVQLVTDNGNGMVFDIVAPKGATTLVAGTYTVGARYDTAFTIIGSASGVIVDGGSNYLYLTEGTMTVALYGDIYALSFNLVADNGDAVTGKCTKKLDWVDYTVATEPQITGDITFGERVIPMVAGQMMYNGPVSEGGNESVNFMIADESTASGVMFGVFVPAGNQRLVAGTYTLSDSKQALTYDLGYIVLDSTVIPVTDGTVTIAVIDEEKYSFAFDLTTADMSVSGTVVGSLLWVDNTVE